MKRKLLCAVMSIVLMLSVVLPSIPAIAAVNLRIEGESYSRASVNVGSNNDSKLSNGKYLFMYGRSEADLTFEYDFDVPQGGLYSVAVAATKLNAPWSSDWMVWVNDEKNMPKEYIEGDTLEAASAGLNTAMAKFKLGAFYLKKGINTIFFKVDPTDKTTDGSTCYLDYIEISEMNASGAELLSIDFSDRIIGMYESTENVGLTMKFMGKLRNDDVYDLQIKDAWGREVLRRDMTAGLGSEITFNLGKFVPGWYRIFVRKKGGDTVLNNYLAFTVTHPYSECKTDYNGTLAADVAGEYDTGTVQRGDEISRANLLQGFKWIRTRGILTTPEFEGFQELKQIQKNAGFKMSDLTTDYTSDLKNIKTIDLMNVYNEFKAAHDDNQLVMDIYEILNEVDIANINATAPDVYAAFYKAAMIGLTDSNIDSYIVMAGHAFNADALFYDVFLQNDVLNYSSVYNFHAYGSETDKTEYARKVANAYSPVDSIRPIYLTENGKKVYNDKDDVVYTAEQHSQAVYAATSAPLLLSKGVDKWFWFLARPYIEVGGGFGSYHAWTYNPYPVTSTLANMTHQLGNAYYIGSVANLPEEVSGFVFDDGSGSDAAVFFSRLQNYIEIKADKIVYSDMYGYEEVKYADENGKIKLLVSPDPIFVKFFGHWDKSNYYPVAGPPLKPQKLEPTVNERVVLNTVWDEQDYNDIAVVIKGYEIETEDTEKISLRVYNMNDEAVSGTVEVTQEYDHFDIAVENPEFSLGPWEQTVIPVTLTTSGTAKSNYTGDIKFTGKLSDGRELSSVVCRYAFESKGMEIKEEDFREFEGYIYPENWDLTNIDSTGVITLEPNEEEQSCTMKVSHGDGYASWLFPMYRVQNPEIFEWDSDGITLMRRNSDNTSVDNSTTIMLYMKDGRQYYSGYSSGVPCSTEDMLLTYPWDVFSLHYSPEGLNDIRPFDIKQIEQISIGVSGTRKESIPDATMWDFGLYREAGDTAKAHPGTIELSGIEDGAIYKDTKGLKLVATLPHDDLDEVRVVSYNKVYNNWTRKGNQVEIDLSGLDRGEYTFYVSARNKVNYRYTNYISFFVE